MKKQTLRQLVRSCISDKNIEILSVDYSMNTKRFFADGNITITVKAQIINSNWSEKKCHI